MPTKRLSSPNQMTEAQFQTAVLQLAKLRGYNLSYHTHDSRRSQPGFPDLVLINVSMNRALFRELKTDIGKVSLKQDEWLDGLRRVGLNADVWRPSDLASGRIDAEMRGVR